MLPNALRNFPSFENLTIRLLPFALCPSSPEAVFRYVNLLLEQKRFDDALLVTETAAKVNPANSQLDNLAKEIEKLKQQPKP